MKKFYLMISLIMLFSLAFGEEYKLHDLIDIGLQKSYSIQSENAALLNSKSYLRSSYLGLLPEVSASVSGSRNFDSQADEWSKNASLSISKSIFLNEPSYYNVRTSIIDNRNAQLSVKQQRKQIAFTIFSYFLSVLEAQKNLQIQQQNLQLQEQIHKQIQIQYNNGEKSKLDLKQSEISLIDYEIAVKDAENALSQTRKNLFTYLNENDEGYKFIEPKFEDIKTEKEFGTNLELKQKINDIQKSKVNLFQQKMDFLPNISLSYTLNHQDPNALYDFENYYRTSNTLAINASYNIFDLLDKREALSRSNRNLKLLELDYEISEKEFQEDWQLINEELDNLSKTRDLYEQKLELAQENLNMAQEQYDLGIISLLELDRIKIDYQNAQSSYLNRYYEFLRKQEELRLLTSQKILGKW